MKRLILLLSTTPSLALAHPGDHGGRGLWHFLTEPDHLALMALALVVGVAVVIRYRARR